MIAQLVPADEDIVRDATISLAQLPRAVVGLMGMGRRQTGDRDILIAFDHR
ncbi:hypothetical protein [Streptomyces deccanensis]|uniref:hypothetical protein n=1 Tax=Streptomyces deccanensis TaxID=424188 RepID=UPI001EFC0D32|nr:hypothetical protein [Streptomyces deccanensis]ULR56365.1 hypothetical protein L3078_04000 [Streptomyces deccanensis]